MSASSGKCEKQNTDVKDVINRVQGHACIWKYQCLDSEMLIADVRMF